MCGGTFASILDVRLTRGRWLILWLFLTISCGQDPSFVDEIVSHPSEFVDQSIHSEDARIRTYAADCDTSSIECLASVLGCDLDDYACLSEATQGNEDMGLLVVHSELAQLATERKVDILWVIDSSGSMQEEQSYLAENFYSFIDTLQQSQTDFQTSITSTDVCDDALPLLLEHRACPTQPSTSPHHLRGAFRGLPGQQIISAESEDPVNTFMDYANVGIHGSGFEHGLWAAKLALDQVLTGANDPLIRIDSHLAVIIVSDEEDDGIGLGMADAYSGVNFQDIGATNFYWDHDQMISYLNQHKGAGKFSISAITGTRNSNGELCTSPHSQPKEEGTQYIKAAEATGGIIQSICQSDWNQGLTELGEDLTAQISQIQLQNLPIEGTISVWVNGSRHIHWTYVPTSNTIKFQGQNLPATASEVEIRYLSWQ